MDVRLPNLGEGADSGVVVNLSVKEGDTVAKGQTILELENEKAVAPIPSPAAGVVGRIAVKIGDKISVGQLVLSLAEQGGAPAKAAPAPSAKPKAASAPAPVARPARAEAEPQGAENGEPRSSTKAGFPPAAAPSLRRMADDLGIDLTRVHGSEEGGRIVLADIRAYIEDLQRRAFPEQAEVKKVEKPAPEPVDFAKYGPILKKPMSSLRQIISRRMVENSTTIPHVTQFDEADITGLMELRKKHAAAYEQKGAKLTLTTFALKAVVTALKKFPIFNSSLDEAANEIILKEYYHIGLAVDTEAGLLVPVIRDVDKKSLAELSVELNTLALKARDRKVSLEDLKGGTFTISNQGGIGGAHFTPIVNKPEVAILGLGKGAVKAVVTKEKKIEPRLMLPICLSYDHRVIDGGDAARFTVELIHAFENFKEELL